MRMIAMALGLLLAAHAGVEAQGRQFGFKGGPSFATVQTDEDEPNDPRVAGTFGVFAVLPLQQALSLQIEALFGPRGGKFESGTPGVDATLVIDYIDVPVLARVDWRASDRYGVHLFAGPYAGLRTKAKAELSTQSDTFTSGIDDDISEDIRRLDAGLIAGAGLDVGRRFVIDGRYGWGLVNVSVPADAPVMKHRFFSVMAGLRF